MIRRASKELGVEVETRWFPTPSLEKDVESQLTQVDALWCSPGSPYLSLDGALNGVRFARERGWPIIGTCAGFQHIVLEYARNVIGIKDAAHQEYDAEAETLVLTSLVCPIATQTLRINLLSGSHAHNVYGHGEIEEYYYCNFGINPEFQGDIDKSGLKIVGTDQNGEPRVLELPDHRFFIATLFVPGASYVENEIKIAGSHPLVNALVLAGLSFHSERGSKQSVRSAV
jgi:CTP synthase (UTP-ammonia lyase)